MYLDWLVSKMGNQYFIQADVTTRTQQVVTAGQFVGDSRITGVIGLGNAITANTPVLGNIFYRNNTLVLVAIVTMDAQRCQSNVGYTTNSNCCRRWC